MGVACLWLVLFFVGFFLPGKFDYHLILIPVVDRPCLALVRQCRKKKMSRLATKRGREKIEKDKASPASSPALSNGTLYTLFILSQHLFQNFQNLFMISLYFHLRTQLFDFQEGSGDLQEGHPSVTKGASPSAKHPLKVPFTKAPSEGFKEASPSEGAASRGLEGGFKGA